MNKRIIIFVTAMVLVFAMVTGATFAYMTSLAKTVTNTFVSGGFAVLTIEEPQGDGDDAITPTESDRINEFKVIPGVNLDKNPRIDLVFDKNNLTDAYVFVKITYGNAWSFADNTFKGWANNGAKLALTTNIDTSNWSVHEEGAGFVVLLYQGENSADNVVSGDLTDKSILAYSYPDASKVENKKTINVESGLLETDCEWIDENSDMFDLDFKAYAIQSSGLTPDAAWDQLK